MHRLSHGVVVGVLLGAAACSSSKPNAVLGETGTTVALGTTTSQGSATGSSTLTTILLPTTIPQIAPTVNTKAVDTKPIAAPTTIATPTTRPLPPPTTAQPDPAFVEYTPPLRGLGLPVPDYRANLSGMLSGGGGDINVYAKCAAGTATLRIEAFEDPEGVQLVFSTDDTNVIFNGFARTGDVFSGYANARLRVVTWGPPGNYRFVYDCWHR